MQRFSLAVAGAWGYIGRKFVEAAQAQGLSIVVYDPGPLPDDLDLTGVVSIENESEFFDQQADLFHLALHPEHRTVGMKRLLERADKEPIRLLCEKPMAAPEHPQRCHDTVAAVARSKAMVLYDFPELFDPITQRILDFLAGHREVRIESIEIRRSKDREDPGNPRNEKRMVHIQYQESVHCLAFVLMILARLAGRLESVLDDGLAVDARAMPYRPPNSHMYPFVVDGRCDYQMRCLGTHINGCTDFTRNAPWAKRRTLRGVADGQPFTIEADFLEGKKWLTINGRPQGNVVGTNSYAEVIRTFDRWSRTLSLHELMQGVYPNPIFARVTYQLSSALWASSWHREPVEFESLDDILRFQAGFELACKGFARYADAP